MANLSLMEAFARFGARPAHRLRGVSAIAEDGSLVLSCLADHFHRHAPGVLRYEDNVSREPNDEQRKNLLSQHLKLASDGQLPVRMVVVTAPTEGKASGTIHVRADLVGKITKFDGDHFIIDFTRAAAAPTTRRA